MYLYHGTSDLYESNLFSMGLIPNEHTWGLDRVCLTDDYNIAKYYAEFMAEWDEANGIVFKIPTMILDHSRFTLETNWIMLGPAHGKACGRRIQHKVWDKWSLLAETSAIGYRNRIPVTRSMAIYV